jgi:hypothetical protein
LSVRGLHVLTPRLTWFSGELGKLEELMSLRPCEWPTEDRTAPQLLWTDGRWRDVSEEWSVFRAYAEVLAS